MVEKKVVRCILSLIWLYNWRITCNELVIHIFCPLITKSSPFFTALVLMLATSEPPLGSLTPMQETISPLMYRTRDCSSKDLGVQRVSNYLQGKTYSSAQRKVPSKSSRAWAKENPWETREIRSKREAWGGVKVTKRVERGFQSAAKTNKIGAAASNEAKAVRMYWKHSW